MLEAAMASGLVVGGLDLDYSAAESVSNRTGGGGERSACAS